jgi:hypothetical protein
MRLDITVKNERTGIPIEGAKVAASAEEIGSSESEEGFDLDDVDEDGEYVRSMETVSNEEYSGRAAFEIASWVTELEIEVSHDRFDSAILTITPGLRDKHRVVELSPHLSDATISISEHFHEPAGILIEPAGDVTENLYGPATDIELMPGATETFSFISGRYRFVLKNPPDNYVGETSVSENLKLRDSPMINFTQMDLETGAEADAEMDVEADAEADVDPEPMGTDGPPEESSVGLMGRFKEILLTNGSISDPKPEADPVIDADGESNTKDAEPDAAPSDDPLNADTEGGHSGSVEESPADEEEDEQENVEEDEQEDEVDEDPEDEAVGLGALFD